MNYLCLDVGNKRIGLALGLMIAEEYGTLQAREPTKSFLDGRDGTGQAIDEIKKIIEKERVEKIIIGNPINDDGSISEMGKKIHEFADQMQKNIDCDIVFVDETLTSFVAEEMLKEEGLTVIEAKSRVDQLAAKLILQQYIEEE